jgi:predicted aldo/keto reductase-like oxidoreductase
MRDAKITRRGFLTTSISGLVSTGLVGLTPRLAFADEDEKGSVPEGEIIYRTLGRTGLRIPIVGMGVMNANNPEIVQASYEMGVRFFDTAARYQFGRNEQMVGNVINRLGVRNDIIIATKELRPVQRQNTASENMKKKLMELCEGSLSRLKTDYVDIMYIHTVATAQEANDPYIMEAAALLKEKGMVRFLGISTHESMTEVINAVAENGFYDIVLTVINVSMADDVDLLKAIDNAASRGVGIIAMKTLAGGQRLPDRESLTRFGSSTVATASLKWVLRRDSIAMAIPGYTNYEHMREDVSVARGLDYTPEEKEFLSDNAIKLSSHFCRQCRQCMPTCPNGADVPSLMRTHLYAAQYGNFHEARAVLDDLPRAKGIAACSSCLQCSARCVRDIDIPGRIGDLKVIYA